MNKDKDKDAARVGAQEETQLPVVSSTARAGEIISFLRKRDYAYVRELGAGACGMTVLLHDSQIDMQFVCKKYAPVNENNRQVLFLNFVREIKLLHQLHHKNVVRIFNHYLYPDICAGFILMEYIDGLSIDEFLAGSPERANDVFLQAIKGFIHLEQAGILHRDIRPANIMVDTDGNLKIIDLGFGKRVSRAEDFDKSVTLNWWCSTPGDFREGIYDFRTEVYFVGKLFEGIIQDNDITHFDYSEVLRQMCAHDPGSRYESFAGVQKAIGTERFSEIGFTNNECEWYRDFSDALALRLSALDPSATYHGNLSLIVRHLNDAYQRFMLETYVPNCVVVLRCFIKGPFRYNRSGLEVRVVANFLVFFRGATLEKQRVILSNLQTKLDAVKRADLSAPDKDPFPDIPF